MARHPSHLVASWDLTSAWVARAKLRCEERVINALEFVCVCPGGGGGRRQTREREIVPQVGNVITQAADSFPCPNPCAHQECPKHAQEQCLQQESQAGAHTRSDLWACPTMPGSRESTSSLRPRKAPPRTSGSECPPHTMSRHVSRRPTVVCTTRQHAECLW